MKRITSLALLLLVTISTFAKAPAGKHTVLKGDIVSVSYGQPAKGDKGATPVNGTIFRNGVGEPTLVTLSVGCLFAGRQVNPGTYSLLAVPGKDEWEIILNKVTDNAENFNYEGIKEQNILDGQATVTQVDKKVDAFSIELNVDGIVLCYGNNHVNIQIRPF